MIVNNACVDDHEGQECQERNGDKSKIFNKFGGAGNASYAWSQFVRNQLVIQQIVENGYAHANERERQDVVGQVLILFYDSNKDYCHQRVRCDALVPTKHAWRVVKNFTEEKTSGHRQYCLKPGNIENVFLEPMFKFFHRVRVKISNSILLALAIAN